MRESLVHHLGRRPSKLTLVAQRPWTLVEKVAIPVAVIAIAVAWFRPPMRLILLGGVALMLLAIAFGWTRKKS